MVKFAALSILLMCSTALVAPSLAVADSLLGIYAGAGGWNAKVAGQVNADISGIDVEEDLELSEETSNMFYVAVEHGLIGLPNLRAQFSTVDVSGANTLARSIEFEGRTFNLSDDIASQVELNHADAIMYYQVLDNALSLDMGLSARWVDGSVEIASPQEMARAEFDAIVPMLYSKARIDLPLSGFWFGAEAQGIAYDGDHLFDANAQLGWESTLGLGAELGWRVMQIEVESYDDFDDAQLDVTGPYLAINYHF